MTEAAAELSDLDVAKGRAADRPVEDLTELATRLRAARTAPTARAS